MNARELAEKLLLLVNGRDSYTRERNRTSAFRVRWRKSGPLRCAVCGECEPTVPIDVAHIVALEEYGQSVEKNLLPLCSTGQGNRRRNTAAWLQKLLDLHEGDSEISLGQAFDASGLRMGCHQLLDYGVVCKRTFMDSAALNVQVRKQALAEKLSALGGEFGVRSKGSRVMKARSDVSKAKGLGDDLRRGCVLISLLRRTDDAGVNEALEICRRLLPTVDGGTGPCPTRSRFYYEYALALQVGKKQENLAETQRFLAESKTAAIPAKGSWGMSELELVHAEVFSVRPETMAGHVDSWLERQEHALACLDADTELSSHNKARWRMNYLIGRAQLLVKVAAITPRPDTFGVRRALDQAWEYRNGLTAKAGWTRFQAVHLLTLEGILRHLGGEHEEAIQCLARALRPMKVGRGKRPEGVRDVAYCLSHCFKALGEVVTADKAELLAGGVFDQRSGVLWPR